MEIQVSHEPDEVAASIREFCRSHPELRKDSYQTEEKDVLDGHCYVASEAYYHATGRTLDVYCLSWDRPGTHWFLHDGNRFIDLTGDPDDEIAYEDGVKKGFLTGDTPSKRAQKVLDAIDVEVSIGDGLATS